MLTHNFVCVQKYFNPLTNLKIQKIVEDEYFRLLPKSQSNTELPQLTAHLIGWKSWGRFYQGDFRVVPKVEYNKKLYVNPTVVLSLYNYLLYRFADLCRGNPSWKSNLSEKLKEYQERALFEEGVTRFVQRSANGNTRLAYSEGCRTGIRDILEQAKETKILAESIQTGKTDFEVITNSMNIIRERFVTLLKEGYVLGDECKCEDFNRFAVEKGKSSNIQISRDFLFWYGSRSNSECMDFFNQIKNYPAKILEGCSKSCSKQPTENERRAFLQKYSFTSSSMMYACYESQSLATRWYYELPYIKDNQKK